MWWTRRGGQWAAWRGYPLGLAGLVLVTAVAQPLRANLNTVTIILCYLLIVLASATAGGLGPGIVVSVAAFVTFNFFFLPPYYSLTVGAPQDVVALFVFLIVAAVASNLVTRLQARERDAERRARESETLAQLGAALLADVTLDTVLATVVEKVTTVFGFDSAAILLPDEEGTLHLRHVYPADAAGHFLIGREHTALAAHVFATGITAGVGSARRVYRPHGPATDMRTEGFGSRGEQALLSPRRARRVLYVPVRTGQRSVGVLGVAARRADDYSAAERRILATFANEAALAIDRARLTEEATRAAALEKADELKSALLAAVSHDLRTPLASIKASVSSLLQDDVAWDAETRRDFLAAIDEETDRLTRLVGNLLDLTRIEGGALKPEKEWYDVSELIARVTDRLAPLLATRPLSIDIAPDLPILAFDFVEIGQALTNLIENAAKYSAPDAAITITAARDPTDPAFLRVQVRDRGFGIAPADVPHVFDTFFRIRDIKRRRIAGSGIGLAIVKGFVEAHGGHVGVSSTVDDGSTFWFTLPIEPQTEGGGLRTAWEESALSPQSSALSPDSGVR